MMDVRELLEWYVTAGVDAIFADRPCLAVQKVTESLEPRSAHLRPAITDLAQASSLACKNARDICEKAQNLEELKVMVESFDGCALKFNSSNTVFGDGNHEATVMIIGEAPGADEDRIGLPFVGKSGQLLDKMLVAAGLDRKKCYITNVLPWRPPGNRTPTSAEVAVCLPFLRRQIELVSPEIIVVLGGSAANSLLDNEDPISKLRGKWLEYVLPNKKIPVLATFHPAYILRNAAQKAKVWADFLKMMKKMQK